MNDETSAQNPTPETPTPQNPKPPWLMLGGVLLGAIFMALALYFTSQQTRQTAIETLPTPLPLVAATPLAEETPKPPPSGKQEYSFTLFVPNDAGDLVKRQSKDEIVLPADPQQARAAQAKHVVAELMKAAPDDFPKGARLLKTSAEGPTVKLDFNDAFTAQSFWQGATRTTVTIYALVNTVVASTPETKNVQFLVNGKPVEVLGEMDAAEPFQRKDELVVVP